MPTLPNSAIFSAPVLGYRGGGLKFAALEKGKIA
jgi:hypothetical protein